MKKPDGNHLGLIASGILACLSATAGAQIFTEDFNSYSGNQNTTQYQTELEVAHTGSVAGWSRSGAGTMHAVDLANLGGESNPSDWAIMFWQDNVITQTVGIAANVSSTNYEVNFDYGTAVYAATNPDQITLAGDGLLVEVLRADDSVLASQSFFPGAWDDAGNHNLDGGLQGTLPYVGDGTGDVRLRIGPAAGTLNQGRFAGDIDNISVSVPGAPEITSFTPDPATLGDAGDAVTFDWTVTGMPLDSLVITPGDIDVLGDTVGAGIGSYTLDSGPDGTTEYTLTATKGGDTARRKVTVTLPAPEITSFTVSPSPYLAPGGNLTLSWQVGLPATTLTITPGDIDVSGATDGSGTGSIIVNPTVSTTYTLTATRGTSPSTANASIIVQTPPNPNAFAYESFEAITGLDLNGGPDGQVTTTHDLGVGGSLSGWTKSGGGTIHAVDTNNIWTGGTVSTNPPNWGVMIWEDNVITQTVGIAGSNDSGVDYSIDFLAAGAVYENHAHQVNNGTTDGLRIEVLRASDSAVLHSFDHLPAQPVGVGDLGLLPVNFTYTGDGSGDILFRIGPANPGQGRFQGTIDDLQLSVAGPAPVINSFTRVSGDIWELTLLGAANTGYEFRSSTILDFNPGTLVENLTPGDPAVGTIGGDNNSVVTTDDNGDSSGDATVRMMLGGPRNFVRAQIPPPPPPLFEEKFDTDDGGFAAVGTPNDWEWGTPNSDNGFDFILNAGNGGSGNCWGTNLGDGAGDNGFIDPSANSILRGPDATGTGIDLTGVLGAQLRFAAAVDATGGDTLEVLVKEVGTDTLLVTITPITLPATKDWAKLGPFDISAAAGKNAYLEFRFHGTDNTYIGLYIDDVVVTETTP
ncbi:MAG: hypothetical protein K9N23_03805 [Akkermansiaceae bacterium]|nr:hypothetical protein [Akkermansiaceae bacterium]